MELKNVSASISEYGYQFISGRDIFMSESEKNSFIDVRCSWDNLGPDYTQPEIFRFRNGRYGIYNWQKGSDSLCLASNNFHKMHGADASDKTLLREMYPLDYGTNESEFLIQSIRFLHSLGVSARILNDAQTHWHVEITQYRINAEYGAIAGNPTPQGPHHDQFEFVAIIFVDRHNVSLEVSTLYDKDQNVVFSGSYRRPLDMLVFDDKRYFHSVSPFNVINPWVCRRGYRDVLIIGFNRPEFNPNFEGSEFIEQAEVEHHWQRWR